jgi:hypothetical protein
MVLYKVLKNIEKESLYIYSVAKYVSAPPSRALVILPAKHVNIASNTNLYVNLLIFIKNASSTKDLTQRA